MIRQHYGLDEKDVCGAKIRVRENGMERGIDIWIFKVYYKD